MTNELWRLSASELLAGYARRSFSPVEVVSEAFKRIERLDRHLHAYLALNHDDAMASAKRAEARWMSSGEKPPLSGVPVSVKDSVEMSGMPTTYGSLAFKNNMQPDAELVKRLRVAGAVILGKTNLSEFALHAHVSNRLGPSGANPWDLTRTCGGSSGGAAASVASGMGALAVGTDSGGSVRLPAAYNGIFGFKPSFQRVPAVQKWRAAPGRSHNGPMTRTVRDSALLMNAIAGPDRRDPDSLTYESIDYLDALIGNVRGARVAVTVDFGRDESDVLQARLIQEASEVLKELGCTLVKADPPPLEGGDELEPGVWAYSGDHYGAAEALIPGFWKKHADDLTDYARPIYDAGRRALAWKYRQILHRNRAYVERMRQWFVDYDFLLAPLASPAPAIEESEDLNRTRGRGGRLGYLAAFNISYNPASAVPFGYSDDGMPVAVQIVGRHGDDVGVLRMSALLEAARPWTHRWPDFATRTA